MTRPTALRKSAFEGRGVVVLLRPSSSSGVVLRAVVVPHLVHFPEREFVQFTFFLSLSLSQRNAEKQRAPSSRDRGERRRYKVVGVCSLSLSLCVSESGDKESEFKTCFFSIPNERKTLQNSSFASFAFLHTALITQTFAHRKRTRERDDDATRREEASPRIHRPNAFLFFFFFHPRRGRIFAL